MVGHQCRKFIFTVLIFTVSTTAGAMSRYEKAEEFLRRDILWLLVYGASMSHEINLEMVENEAVVKKYRSFRWTYHTVSTGIHLLYIPAILRFFRGGKGIPPRKFTRLRIASVIGLGISIATNILPSSKSSSLGSPEKMLHFETFQNWTDFEAEINSAITRICQNTLYVLDLPKTHLPRLKEKVQEEVMKQAAENDFKVTRNFYVDVPMILSTVESPDGEPLGNEVRTQVLERLELLFSEKDSYKEFESIPKEDAKHLFQALMETIAAFEVFLESDPPLNDEQKKKLRDALKRGKRTLTQVEIILKPS